MHTLYDFLYTTKVTTYAISVGAMVFFAFFWLLLESKGGRRKKKS